ncbi:MAG: phosphoglycerate dehydrogenase [Planctomycetaceae bacterium]|nr:phosphoglycerate dehydrogenase [Planctomycetaceae bacterium]
MLKVLCTALSAEEGPHFDLLSAAGFECDVVPRQLDMWQEDVLISALQGYHGVLAGSEPFTPKVIRSCPDLRVISRTGVGFDAVDLAACDQQKIVVATTPGVNHHAVAEHAIALLMGVARGFPSGDQGVRRCQWERMARPRVMGSILGLIGLGRIGQATATRGIGLGMKVIAYDPWAPQEFVQAHGIEMVSLDDLYSRSDYISLHTPVTPQTRHMINAQTIACMKPTTVLINTARGPLINESDLCTALAQGRLRGAGLDVFEVEPLPADSPLIGMSNVLLSGHVAGLDCESHRDTFAMAADTVISLHQGGWPAERIQNLKNVDGWTW